MARHKEVYRATVMQDAIVGSVWRNSIDDTFCLSAYVENADRRITVVMTRNEARGVLQGLKAHLGEN